MNDTSHHKLPENGWSQDKVLDHLEKIKPDPIRMHWAKAFRATPDVQDLSFKVYEEFFSDNGIFSARVPYMRDIEQQVLQMCLSLLNGGSMSAGNMTSGGSESVYSALHAMREWAKDHKPNCKTPTVIVPYSAHPTFTKGCHYYGLRIVRVAVGADYKADVHAMAALIDEDTIGIVGSAPCWPYGLYDPIEKLAVIAMENNLWMHVDACVGGYLSPFMEQLGHEIPSWDFRVHGVMSISADLHKYGYCPKPCSTILWRDTELQKYHHCHPSDWPGGEYHTTGFAGTRFGGAIFAAWAVMTYLGNDGYLKMARRILDTREKLTTRINAIPSLSVWKSELLPLAVEGVGIDIGKVSSALMTKGWIMLGTQEPPLLNLPIDAAMDDEVINTFITDLTEIVDGLTSGTIDAESKLVYG